MKKPIYLLVICVLVFLLGSCHKEKEKEEGYKPEIIKDAVKDVEGNQYDAVKIGDQMWMAENLRTTRYPDSTEIMLPGSGSRYQGFRFFPDGDVSKVQKYGCLYNWYAVMNGVFDGDENTTGVQGICPDGWHVPCASEWQYMIDYVQTQIDRDVIPSTSVAKALASTEGWKPCTYNCTPGWEPSDNNSTGLSIRPVGYYDDYFEEYLDWGYSAHFWTATKYDDESAIQYYMHTENPDVKCSEEGSSMCFGFSVRCIKD